MNFDPTDLTEVTIDLDGRTLEMSDSLGLNLSEIANELLRIEVENRLHERQLQHAKNSP